MARVFAVLRLVEQADNTVNTSMVVINNFSFK